ncbi:hypothetical protein BURMUCGD1_4028 [Burkholderia multivorans CGD1]|nr:hypothetical protein BURMUCGD1_4028 [Burkholderia multivorans CGD1]
MSGSVGMDRQVAIEGQHISSMAESYIGIFRYARKHWSQWG